VQSGDFNDIEFNKSNNSIVYASGTSYYRSVNSGVSFTQITAGLPSSVDVSRMEIGVTPANSNYVYIITSNNVDEGFYGIYRSTDGGLNFSLMSNS
jgi:hypothetical protein